MITPTAEQRLRLLFANGNRALAEAIRQATPEQLELMKEGKSLKELLASLTGEALRHAKSNTLLLEILRNSPAFRQPDAFTGTLGSLLRNLEAEQAFSELRARLQAFHTSVASPAGLKQQVRDSGIFLEAKLLASADGKTALPLADDVKALLLRLQEQVRHTPVPSRGELLKQIDTLLLQIDYHQLYSYLSSAAVLYFPYAWELLEEGSLAFKRAQDQTSYCRIELRLKRFGELHLLVALSGEKRIAIRARAERETLVDRIREQLPALRSALRQTGLEVERIEIARFEPRGDHSAPYGEACGDIDLGFEVKI